MVSYRFGDQVSVLGSYEWMRGAPTVTHGSLSFVS